MDRKILFRGMSKKTMDWVHGYYYEEFGEQYIIDCDTGVYHPIEPGSRGQYIGFEFWDDRLKMNIKPFEGDVFAVQDQRRDGKCECCGAAQVKEHLLRVAIFYEEKEYCDCTDNTTYTAMFVLKDYDGISDCIRMDIHEIMQYWNKPAYVGTLYENPEILEEVDGKYPPAKLPKWIVRRLKEREEREKTGTDCDIRTDMPEDQTEEE